MLLTPSVVFAQNQFKVSGQVIETQDYAPVMGASVKILTKDSVYVEGGVTNDNGNFSLTVPKKAPYKVMVSYLGYKTLMKEIEVKGKTTTLGTLRLDVDSILLDDAVITAALPKMQVVEDTVIYNADAFKVPDGAVLDELIERLPGAEVTEDGITINGKKIEKILLNGKEFFVGDMNTARKNVPVDIVDKVKVYDEKSDMAKVTGIDDGNDRPVIDIKIKKGMDIGTMVNGDAGYGTHDRYFGRVMATAFSTRNKLAFVGNGSNLSNGRSTPGGRGGGGGQGLRTSETAGLNYNYDDKGTNGRKEPTLQMDGSVQYNHGTSDRQTRQMNENWEKVGSRTYGNSVQSNLSKNHGWNANYRLEWRPDTLTNIQFRPSMSFNVNDGLTSSRSMQFSENPYDYSDDPLSLYDNFVDTDAIRTNYRNNQGISHSVTKRFGGSLQYNRRFGNMGRNLTFRVEGNYNNSESRNISNNMTHFYKQKDRFGNDSILYTNRYNVTPGTTWNYAAQVSYSEPLMKATFLQFSYRFNYSHDVHDRQTYDFSGLGERFGYGVTPAYGDFDGFLADYDLQRYLDDRKSQYALRQNMDHDAQVLFRIIRTYYNFSTGVRWQPQRSHFVQEYLSHPIDTVRYVSNFSPTMNLLIRFSKQHTLKLDYRGNTSQPSLTSMIDITDDTNPMNITLGNPDLKPSFTNNMSTEWKLNLPDTKTSFAANWNFATTSNSISSKVTYDDKSGGRTTRPENINGNWNTGGNISFNTALDYAARWNLSVHSNFRHSNQVSYISVDRNADSKLNTTKNNNLGGSLGGSYRNDWLDVSVDGGVNYSHVRNMLMTSANRDTYNFHYGTSLNIRLPWEMTINTSIRQNSRRGYTDAQANTNELIWNAQISQSLLSRRRLMLTLQIYDILGQQKTFDYNVGATRISETHYNSITQYAMLHVIFNFRSFGGKAARDARRERGENRGEWRGDSRGERNGEGFGGGGGRPGGGYGGGRPGGGFGGGRGPR